MADTKQERLSPSATYWQALEHGALRFQKCSACRKAWLPAREECPGCWSSQWSWETASGKGRLVSWVVFHTSFHEAFADRLPYNVAVVELSEGPRLVTNIVDLHRHSGDVNDRTVSLVIERDHDRALPRFRIGDP
jgi:uncharacterized OB-fold protein